MMEKFTVTDGIMTADDDAVVDGGKFYLAHEVDQRIAELEKEVDELKKTAVACNEAYELEETDNEVLHKRIAELEAENARLRETRVPDDLLERLVVFMLDTGDFQGSEDKTYEEARTILNNRKEYNEAANKETD